jgi:hypothetical protein
LGKNKKECRLCFTVEIKKPPVVAGGCLMGLRGSVGFHDFTGNGAAVLVNLHQVHAGCQVRGANDEGLRFSRISVHAQHALSLQADKIYLHAAGYGRYYLHLVAKRNGVNLYAIGRSGFQRSDGVLDVEVVDSPTPGVTNGIGKQAEANNYIITSREVAVAG